MSQQQSAQGQTASPQPNSSDYNQSLAAYALQGAARARALGCRGKVRRTAAGTLHPDILESYWKHGFYIFESVVKTKEIKELRDDIQFLLDHAPVSQGAALDAQGKRAFGQDMARSPYLFIKPLSDPWGGTAALNGRHPTQMQQPTPATSAPAEVVHIMSAMCETMPSGLRLYGHPDLLSIAAAINGDDFVPYNDATFVKQPGLGGSVSWHQDGVTHWDSPVWDEGIHGFNFQVQLYPCTAENGLWVVPGSHKLGRIDIKAKIAANGGSEQLPDAMPLQCEAGDVTVVNRQVLHGSFANTSPNPRVSLTFGFHRRRSVLGAQGALSQSASEVYDADRIFQRSALIAVAIDARRQHYPTEPVFSYVPFAHCQDEYGLNDANYERYVRDYYFRDLSI